MTFANPYAFWGLLIIVPIIVCYLLRVRLRRVTVSSVMFWEQVAEDHPERALHPQLRHFVSLLCQLMIVLILVLALADPRPDHSARDSVILVIDNSASMGAVDPQGTSRLEKALEHAGNVINTLGPEQQAAVFSTSADSVVHCGLTHHARTLRQSLEEISQTESAGRLKDAIEQAVQLADDVDATILLLTDSPPENLPDPVAPILIGTEANNLAITQFQVRTSLSTPDIQHAFIEVRSFCDRASDIELEYRVNDQLVNVIPLTIEPDGSWTHVSDHPTGTGGILTVTLSPADDSLDALKLDNIACGVIKAPARLPVTLVTKGGWFLGHAIDACEFTDLTVTTQIPNQADPRGLLVIDADSPGTLPPGNLLIVRPRQATSLWDISEQVPEPLVGFQESDDRLLQHVHLKNVLMPSAVGISPKGEHQRLVDSISGSPLFVRFPREEGDVYVLTIDIDHSDLPLRTAFPILLNNLMSKIAMKGSDDDAAVATGTTVIPLNSDSLQAAAGSRKLTAVHMASDYVAVCGGLTADRNSARFSLPYAGVWELQTQDSDAARQLIACNLADASESNLKQVSTVKEQGRSLRQSSGQPWFLLLAVACLILVLAEWTAWHRRMIA